MPRKKPKPNPLSETLSNDALITEYQIISQEFAGAIKQCKDEFGEETEEAKRCFRVKLNTHITKLNRLKKFYKL